MHESSAGSKIDVSVFVYISCLNPESPLFCPQCNAMQVMLKTWNRLDTAWQQPSQFQRVKVHFDCSRHQWPSDLFPLDIVLSLSSSSMLTIIDDSTPVSRSRHTLRFQPIACRSIMRCPRVLTRPEMIWQAFVPDIASVSWQCSTWQKNNNNKKPGKRNCCYG